MTATVTAVSTLVATVKSPSHLIGESRVPFELIEGGLKPFADLVVRHVMTDHQRRVAALTRRKAAPARSRLVRIQPAAYKIQRLDIIAQGR
jgi:hypothetical protein